LFDGHAGSYSIVVFRLLGRSQRRPGDLVSQSVSVFLRKFHSITLFYLAYDRTQSTPEVGQHVALLLVFNFDSACQASDSEPIIFNLVLTVDIFLVLRFVGHDRRYSHRSQQYAFVNFNISAGVFFFLRLNFL
jgi:hypothetical protein